MPGRLIPVRQDGTPTTTLLRIDPSGDVVATMSQFEDYAIRVYAPDGTLIREIRREYQSRRRNAQE
jgi:hypothetical protein